MQQAEYDLAGRRWFCGDFVIKRFGVDYRAFSNDWLEKDGEVVAGKELGPFDSLEEAEKAIAKE